MGVELVEGRDLLINDNVVYTRTTSGLKRVDVIYRRVDDDFIDPLDLPRGFVARRPGPVQRLSRRQRGDRQRARAPASPTTRRSTPMCRGSSAITWPKSRSSHSVETFLCRERKSLAHVLANLDKLVVKAVGESGGYGMLVGPHASAGRARSLRRKAEGRSRQLHRPAHDPAFHRAHLRRRRYRAAPRRSAALHPARRGDRDRARRADARGAQGAAASSSIRARAAARRTPGC